MNKTIAPAANQSSVTSPICLTDESQANREHKPPDHEIRSAFENLLRLHSSAGEAVAQFAVVGAIRQVIFRPGSLIFLTYERDARAARDAVNRLGDPNAASLMGEIVKLADRMSQLEASLPPAGRDTMDF